ncbi:uncharacterized protein (DUF302 family) [Halarchaeum rubridurum]|uniref:Uncharacterized protein (DUF302 family) n=1 Tax=Halarchaeum rubridurum TaxID=489911 RepID=A0A830FUT2_9EURY|nr:DUF302 domain-containing protein [Halarchaeum rubridurum]MBP1954747.1 uncharacterized protein (DUF302 family) [Halarchaeum rubridurum]GGM63610.1 hypothetical protein GCM10009017_12050 [Halarchaeum rubridurum]
MSYTLDADVDGSFEDVVARTEDALAEEGFGVLCDVDVEATFAAKLDVDFRKYRILGACNPPLAHEGLEAEPGLGALLPCNVVVYEADDGTVAVRAVDPVVLLESVDNPALDEVATEVRERFERVLDSLNDADE